MTSLAHFDATKLEHEIRIRRSERARQAELFKKNHGSSWSLKSLLTRFGR